MPSARARHILVPDEATCNSLKSQIAGGVDFAAIAKTHSTCPSGKSGGDLGYFRPGAMVPEFDKAVFNKDNPVGAVIGPVKTQFGYHLLQVTDRKD